MSARGLVAEQAHMAGTLHDVIRSPDERAAAEREDHGVGVQRTQPAVVAPGNIEVQRRPVQLRGAQDTDGHADDAHTRVMMANCRTTLSLYVSPLFTLMCASLMIN